MKPLGYTYAARGGVPEWPKGTGCKPVGSAYVGSNPTSPTCIPLDTREPLNRAVHAFRRSRESARTTYITTYIEIRSRDRKNRDVPQEGSYYSRRSARDPDWRERQIQDATERRRRRHEANPDPEADRDRRNASARRWYASTPRG